MATGGLTPLHPPRRLGDITLLATLGEGGMATVYLAAVGRGALARPAAVKLVRADVAGHDYRVRFLDEAKLVVRLQHNNLVQVTAAGEIDGELYIAMEIVEGRDLGRVWNRCARVGRAFPIALSVHVMREVLRGLHHAHTAGLGLVHRDISPSNILLDWAGAIRVADFGLATSSLKTVRTKPGVVFGKVGYMAPEQARGGDVDARADVYGCGAVLWELITGRMLRPGDGNDMNYVAAFEAPPPSQFSRRVDGKLDGIVSRALALEPDERFESADAMMRALGDWLGGHAPSMGQDAAAEFLAELYPDARETERTQREQLMEQAEEPSQAVTRVSAAIEPPRRTADPEMLESGAIIGGRYRVLSKLGRGGMGTVYLGEHVTVGRSVAIKVLTFEWSHNDSVVQRFRAEARAASAAGHPNIIEVFDAGELPDGRLYLVMEFVKGRNLFDEVQGSGPMGVARACRIVRDVARAVRAAHEVGIIHRDLKLDNVMLDDRDGEIVKVLDFGISASAERTGERLTHDGQALGTPEYMAPEQALGHPATPRFDVYALGAILYELLCGEPPFLGGSAVEIMTRKQTEPAPKLADRRSGLPRDVVRLVHDCLEIDPDKRPVSVRVFLSRLDGVLHALPRDGSVAAAAASTNRTALAGVTGVALAAALAVGGWWFLSGDSTDPGSGAPAASSIPPARDTGPSPADGGERGAGSAGVSSDSAEVGGAPAIAAVESSESAAIDAEAETSQTSDTSGSVPPEIPEPFKPSGPPEPSGTTDADEPSGSPTAGDERTPPGATEGDSGGQGSETAPEHTTPSCRRTRAQAEESAKAGAWGDVLTRVRSRSCWPSATERARLEVQALKESGRFAECARVGRGFTDPGLRRIVRLCEKRSEDG
jgi:serine/threonine-protein kinase